ncbi:MAG TPA: hypothetical protein VJN43_20120 [Bryobacteraceae bacterium]|nr:hypothetical protein [Bryobacteraceae bacterium]
MRKIAAVAVVSSTLTLLAVWAAGWGPLPSKVKLDNERVRVTEVTAPPGAPRERHIRQSDQVIVFLDDCRYERTNSETGAKSVQERKSGDVIFHHKGEDAPQLINLGSKPYRTLLIELKGTE